MAVDLLAPLRQAYGQRIQSELELANRKERERQRQEAARQNRIANVGSLVGAVAGGVAGAGNPAAIAAGASLGNMAGRAISGGQAPGVAEIASTGAQLYGLNADVQQTKQNEQINQALTSNAINELQGGLPQGMTPENVQALQSSDRLAQTFSPGAEGQLNVAENRIEASPQDQRLAELFGPGQVSGQLPNPQQQKTLDNIRILQQMQGGEFGRVAPQTTAAVVDRFLPKQPAKSDLFVVKDASGQQIAAGLSIADAQSVKAQSKGSSIYKMATEPTDRSSTAGTEFERVRPMLEEYNRKVAAGEPITAKEHSDYALNYSKYSRPSFFTDASGAKYEQPATITPELGYVAPPNMQEIYKMQAQARQEGGGQQGQFTTTGDVPRVDPAKLHQPTVAAKGVVSPQQKSEAAATLAVGNHLDTIFKNLDVFGDVPLSNIHRRVGRFLGQDQGAISVKNALDSMINDFAQAAKGTQTEGDVSRFKQLTGNLDTPVKEVITAARTIAKKLAIESNSAYADAIAENRKPSYAQQEAVRKFSSFEPISVRNKELYDSLPSGTYYIDSKGNRARKP